MPVTKRVVTTFDVTYDEDLKIQVNYNDLKDIVKTGLNLLEIEDADEIRGNGMIEYLPFAELQRIAAKQGFFVTTSNRDVHSEVEAMMAKGVDPDLKACMAYTFLGRKVDAIKHLRAATGFGLKEAKDTVELVDEIGMKVSLFEIMLAVEMESARRSERLVAGTFNNLIETDRYLPGYKE